MTPALVSGFGIAPNIAVGTDLAFAAITKSVGIAAHRTSGAIKWPIVWLLIGSSITGCVAALWMMRDQHSSAINGSIKFSLGIALLCTAIALVVRPWLPTWMPKWHFENRPLQVFLTLVFGALIGWLVAWSSIGAGAIGCTLLTLLYPELEPHEVSATDIAYAVPLTAVGAIGHAFSGNLNMLLLLALLIGSTPAIWLGVKWSKRLKQPFARGLLATLLSIAAWKSLA